MAVELNTSAVTKANSLISSGNTKNSQSWNPPSTNEENSYIEQNGMTAFANWFLGEDTSIVPENKTRYKYIYTSDFQNVDRAGLIAIRQRAGQQGETSIFDAAGAMIEKIDNKSNASTTEVQEVAPVQEAAQETIATQEASTTEAACNTKTKAANCNGLDMTCEDPMCEICKEAEAKKKMAMMSEKDMKAVSKKKMMAKANIVQTKFGPETVISIVSEE